ncbi:hypothetical protein GCM10009670_30220 [Citricoccus alkalitolerans]
MFAVLSSTVKRHCWLCWLHWQAVIDGTTGTDSNTSSAGDIEAACAKYAVEGICAELAGSASKRAISVSETGNAGKALCAEPASSSPTKAANKRLMIPRQF